MFQAVIQFYKTSIQFLGGYQFEGLVVSAALSYFATTGFGCQQFGCDVITNKPAHL